MGPACAKGAAPVGSAAAERRRSSAGAQGPSQVLVVISGPLRGPPDECEAAPSTPPGTAVNPHRTLNVGDFSAIICPYPVTFYGNVNRKLSEVTEVSVVWAESLKK